MSATAKQTRKRGKRSPEPVQVSMTEQLARSLLAEPLCFGDPGQLRAIRFVRALEKARQQIMRCKHCLGDGIDKRRTACRWCACYYSAEVLAALGIHPAAWPE